MGKKLYYPKIKTLFSRGDDFKVKPWMSEVSHPAFANIKTWHVTEKLDGTNASLVVEYDSETDLWSYDVRGRTPRAEFNAWSDLRTKLLSEKYSEPLIDKANEWSISKIEVFGEVIGPKIQQGGWYCEEQQFVVFDVRVGRLWLERPMVQEYADLFGFQAAPVVAERLSAMDVVDLVRKGTTSALTDDERICEGVIARPSTGELRDNRGDRVIFKLKNRDF